MSDAASQTPAELSRPIVILGMHRSGTSALAGALQKLGVYLGEPDELYKGDRWNPNGYFEYSRIVELNDELLRSAGAAWDAPPDEEGYKKIGDPRNSLLPKARDVCADLARRAADRGTPWGFKDPRLCLTWIFWRQVLQHPRVVLCIRPPAETIASLQARNQFSSELAVYLVDKYLSAVLAHFADGCVTVVSYADLVSRPVLTIGALSTALRHKWMNEDVVASASTIKPTLVHHRANGVEPVPDSVLAKYRSLMTGGKQAQTVEESPAGKSEPALLEKPNKSEPPLFEKPNMDGGGLALLAQFTKACPVYLEYGCGGSTFFAAKQGVKHIVAVESDPVWVMRVREALSQSSSEIHLLHCDLGPVAEWGRPKNDAKIRSFPEYCILPWRLVRERSLVPRLVLIDGRFRVACFLATLLNARVGTPILFDDYLDRSHYHVVERFCSVAEMRGRMALFIATRQFSLSEAVETLLEYSLVAD